MTLSLSKLPWYAQLGAFVVLAVGAVGTYYYYLEMPARTEMATREAQLKALKVDIEKGQATAKKLPEFRGQVEELEHRLTGLRAVLPEEKDAADLLRRMQTVATQSNLTISSFKPAPVVTKQLHAEWPINLELQGNYHNLATFFDRIAKFTRIVNVSALDVKGKDKNQSEPGVTLAAKCVATTFVLLDTPTPDKTKPDAKAGAKKPAAPKKVA